MTRLHTHTFGPVILLALLLCSTDSLTGQDDYGQKVAEAIRLVDAGKLDKGWDIFEELRQQYPQRSALQYEQAFIRAKQERYRDAITILEGILDAPDRTDNTFQLLANCYDYIGETEKAIRTYERGLKSFPNSGPLYLELGVVKAQQKEYAEAVDYWEQGLTVDPDFPSNYFHAGHMYMGTEVRGWGQLYSEIFLNLEPESERAAQLRRVLWASMNDAIELASEVDTSIKNEDGSTPGGGLHFFAENSILFDDETKQLLIPFSYMYEMSMVKGIAILSKPQLTVANLHTFRSTFLDTWYENKEAADFFNVSLFAYQKQLKDADLLDVYDYLLFYCEETADEVEAWVKEHQEKVEQYATWLAYHPYTEESENPFSRLTIKGIPAGEDLQHLMPAGFEKGEE